MNLTLRVPQSPVRVNTFAQLWTICLIGPFATASAYGLWFEAGSAQRSAIFGVLGSWVPLEAWSLIWLVVAVGSLLTLATRDPHVFRATMTVGAGAGTAQFAATVWARWVDGAPLTTVGVSWSYLVAGTFVMSVVAMVRHPVYWLVPARGQ